MLHVFVSQNNWFTKQTLAQYFFATIVQEIYKLYVCKTLRVQRSVINKFCKANGTFQITNKFHVALHNTTQKQIGNITLREQVLRMCLFCTLTTFNFAVVI